MCVRVFVNIYKGCTDEAVKVTVEDEEHLWSSGVLDPKLFRGCHRQPLYCFHFDFRYVTLVL